MTIGERIRDRRIELGMTQDELAKKTGYKSRSSINKLESARVLPSRKIEKMAEALDCRPAYLMGWTDSPMDGTIVQVLHDFHDIDTHEVERARFDNSLTDHERDVIAAYRNSDASTRRLILYALKLEEMKEMENGTR